MYRLPRWHDPPSPAPCSCSMLVLHALGVENTRNRWVSGAVTFTGTNIHSFAYRGYTNWLPDRLTKEGFFIQLFTQKSRWSGVPSLLPGQTKEKTLAQHKIGDGESTTTSGCDSSAYNAFHGSGVEEWSKCFRTWNIVRPITRSIVIR